MEITKGDNKSFKFQRKTKNGEVITDLPDEIYITFKPNAYDEKALFQKRLGDSTIKFNEDTNHYEFEIIPSDTDDLNYGTYYFDIELISNGKKKTIHKGELEITKQYTFPANEVE